MKYLNEGGQFGDTAFNSWPVPLVPMANLPKTSQKVHDDILKNDPAEDSGAEDGAGSAVVQDLGDSVIPFAREMSENLTREMIHVFDVDVGVFFTPGSGKSLMAVILENRRAIAIVKNKAQKDFIMEQLTAGVKSLNLVADTRPRKPQHLIAWEMASGGAAKAGGAAPKAGGLPVLGSIPGAPSAPLAQPPTGLSPPPGAGAGGGLPLASGKAPSPILPPVGGAGAAVLLPPTPASSAESSTGLAGFGASVLR